MTRLSYFTIFSDTVTAVIPSTPRDRRVLPIRGFIARPGWTGRGGRMGMIWKGVGKEAGSKMRRLGRRRKTAGVRGRVPLGILSSCWPPSTPPPSPSRIFYSLQAASVSHPLYSLVSRRLPEEPLLLPNSRRRLPSACIGMDRGKDAFLWFTIRYTYHGWMRSLRDERKGGETTDERRRGRSIWIRL